MIKKYLLLFFFCFAGISAANCQQTYKIRLDSINLFDIFRNRSVPVALYLPDAKIEHHITGTVMVDNS